MNIKNHPQSKFTPQINQNVSFSGSKTDELLKVIPDSKVAKNIRPLDINLFRNYVFSRPYRMNISAEEFNTLKNLEENEFFLKSHELISKELGIPDEVAPGMMYAKLNPEVVMAYIPNQNIICLNVDAPKTTKAQKFAFMRHEFQHYMQNTSVLRHETIGEKAVEEYTKNYVEVQKAIVKPLLEMSDEDILKVEDINHDIVLKIKECTLKNDTETIDKIYAAISEEYSTLIKAFRNNLIEKMGLIEADSVQTPKIQNRYEEFLNVGYYKQDQSIDYNKYFESNIESEAIKAQLMAQSAFEGRCPIATNRDEVLKIIEENPKFLDAVL